ncbi:MAG: hypothetical protein ABJK28_13445 [Algibacter sp.]
MAKFNNGFCNVIALLYCSIFFSSIVGFSQNNNDYIRFIDSADNYIDQSSKKALVFLDSIPNPVEDYIVGRIGDYYALKALIHDHYNETAEVYQNYILSYKYAVKEENFKTAGEACLEIFSCVYFAKRDSTAYEYLDKAKDYYQRCNYKNGLIEIDQIDLYVKFINREYELCNNLILQKMDSYKAVEDDAYYEMFATYMLILNYIYLDDLEKAHFYFRDFEKIKERRSIVKYNYLSFKATIEFCFADIYFEKKKMYSTRYYLSESSKLRDYMGEDVVEDFYGLYADYYNYLDDLEASRAYLDSLRIFQNKMYNGIVDASFILNDKLLKAENEIVNAKEKDFFERFWIVLLLVFLITISSVFIIRNRKSKLEITEFQKKNDEYSYLKVNHEKLKLRVHGLEEYITDVKKEVKSISSIDDMSEQRNKIKELYKDVHLNSSTVLSKEENHLELITDLNVDFFSKISSEYPQLNDSEVIICYYLFTDFKSKEIAVFLGTSTRAIESKRYRIRKKLKIQPLHLSLHDFLHNTFGDLKDV